jgi:hypothetical protein
MRRKTIAPTKTTSEIRFLGRQVTRNELALIREVVTTCTCGGVSRGGCYRAANWIELGVTSGRGRMDRLHEREGVAPKTVLVYPLAPDAVRRLRER